MELLVPYLRAHFDDLQDRMAAFAKHGVQCEGWFKGELLNLLDALSQRQLLQSVDREVRHSAALIDLVIDAEQRHWVELKHWLIGEQKGTTYGPKFYFRDRSSVGIIRDASKLLACPEIDQRWLLILVSKNPGLKLWQEGIAGFNDKFYPIRVDSRTDPSQFPSTYFLGLLSVKRCVQLEEVTQVHEPTDVPNSD